MFCPSCGEKIEADSIFCGNCGTRVAEVETPAGTAATSSGILTSNVDAVLKRGFLALEDGEWEKADAFFEQVLNHDAEAAEAYLGKLMAQLHAKSREALKNCDVSIEANNNYQKAVRFGDEDLKAELVQILTEAKARQSEIELQQMGMQPEGGMTDAEYAEDSKAALYACGIIIGIVLGFFGFIFLANAMQGVGIFLILSGATIGMCCAGGYSSVLSESKKQDNKDTDKK